MRRLEGWLLPVLVLGLMMGACDSSSPSTGDDIPIDDEYGKPLLDVDPGTGGKADTFDGGYGPMESGISSTTEVWKVTRRWYQTDPAAGIAWPADSELTWDEKYAAWIESMPQLEDGYYTTFTMTTPWGKTLPSPALECAETAIFLRATFASWYNLPFYMSAGSGSSRIHYGHFGIVDADGRRLSGYPKFRDSYRDYTDTAARMSSEELIASWPKDENLRTKFLTTRKDDANDFLGDEAYAGAYFDEIYLNKRVGHFMLRLLTNFGSMHLAGATNTFNLKPDATRSGDVLLERWQRNGIGHTLVVKHTAQLTDAKMEIEAMYGSMPRIQPRWYDTAQSKHYFTSEMTGGEGENYDGDEYATLGGGIKRWRTPVVKSGRWYNIVPVRDRELYIDSADKASIAARPARFAELMGELSPAEKRDVAIARIEDARRSLEAHPASCASRTRREEAFAELYEVERSEGHDTAMTDRTYRTFDDYVFAELQYEVSKTCCWNSTTAAMYQIVMAYNEQHVLDHAQGTCNEPVVFKASNGGGYDVFADYAAAIGQGDAWVRWTEDEPCSQRDVAEDTEVEHAWTDFCDVRDDVLDTDRPTN
ncbi:MAG: hypothetical protein EP329_02005 [Deltaproteobacteria bacterium]|nr:MAG: hypothetical protein EP329_02005 [Deltaproteobacteria bacterium]